MSQAVSPFSGQAYGLTRVLNTWGLPRSSFYFRKVRPGEPAPARRRGPKPGVADAALAEAIRREIASSCFHGEGYRKIWARLRHNAAIRVAAGRVLRVMRENGLLSPARRPPLVAAHPHDGTITTAAPDLMWGTDGTATATLEDGQVTVFAALDHCTAECVGLHAAKPATRFEALEPIRQGVAARFGAFAAGAARGLRLRHDHGSQYMSEAFQQEIAFLGIEASPSFVRQPEGNGCIERFFRTLKEQLLWVRTFRNLEELRLALIEFREQYNRNWLIGRLGYQAPAAACAALRAAVAAA